MSGDKGKVFGDKGKIVIVEYALAYVEAGFHIFPAEWRTNIPKDIQKRPLVKWEDLQARPNTEEEVRGWWAKWVFAGIGWVTGAVSGIVVIDIESVAGFDAFRAKYGDPPQTLMQRTGKPGGFHLIFKHPRDGLRYQNQTKIKIDGKKVDVDTRGDGGYILVAPSMHPVGKRYEWVVDPLVDPLGFDLIADLPEHYKEIFSPYKDDGRKKKKTDKDKGGSGDQESKNPDGWVDEYMNGVDEGQRNDWCAKLGGYFLRMFEGDVLKVTMMMRSLNERNRPPMDWKEIDKTIESIAKRHGTDDMGSAVGEEIDRVEWMVYPDGQSKVNVYLADRDGYVQMTMKEFGQFSQFKWRFFEKAGYIPKPIDQIKWEKKVNKAVEEAEIIYVKAEETPLGMILAAIERAVSSRDISDNPKYINQRIIVGGENGNRKICFKLTMLMSMLKFEGDKLNRTQVGELLRKSGFSSKASIRDDDTGGQQRCWAIEMDKFQTMIGKGNQC